MTLFDTCSGGGVHKGCWKPWEGFKLTREMQEFAALTSASRGRVFLAVDRPLKYIFQKLLCFVVK